MFQCGLNPLKLSSFLFIFVSVCLWVNVVDYQLLAEFLLRRLRPSATTGRKHWKCMQFKVGRLALGTRFIENIHYSSFT